MKLYFVDIISISYLLNFNSVFNFYFENIELIFVHSKFYFKVIKFISYILNFYFRDITFYLHILNFIL